MLVLCATLLVELPVLLMITGGSDALCGLIGRRRFYLLIGMIPLTNAISGNVGLQASNLTTRAISRSHVTVGSYKRWFVSEVCAAAYLGLGMGCLLGSIALFASEMDFEFAFTIMIAQFISIVTAGITGTFAPLLFCFVFKRDSGKWGGPLETALQDIVGTFAMVVVSYYLLAWFGAGNVDPSDSCGTVS
jgi:Mg/Co/Ni transporter MgtE